MTDQPAAPRPRRRAGVNGNLLPFDSESGRAAARKSAEARRALAVERANAEKARRALVSVLEGMSIGDLAKLSATNMLAGLVDGSIEVKPTLVPNLLKVVHDIHRLEHGEATSITERKTRDEMLDEIRKLHDDLAKNDAAPATTEQ